ncbi:MAG: MFS transporter [Defluviitaleaceae bacterium]|nr:MFS transporter [Defluviitaleaceae bacterium]
MKKMFEFLFSLKGNAKACLLTEPLWGIPFNLYAPFVTLYMYHLGVLDVQIGVIVFVGRLIQIATALVGGIVTDKFGRRKTTLVGDIISWSIPALIWAFSQNFWWFMAAAVVNASWQVTSVSWECLLVDDADESKMGPIFNWLYVAGLLAVFFAPIAGYFVGIHGVVPVMQVLYLFTFVSMTSKFIILYFYSTETDRGIERLKATKNTSMTQMLVGYTDVLKIIFKSKDMLQALSLQAIVGVVMLITSTFFALYATQNLAVPEAFLGYFPILRAGVMLVFLMVIQEKLSKFNPRHVMMAGIAIYIVAMVWLLGAPQYNWVWIAVYVFMDACAAAMVLPRIDAFAANAINPKERARIRSLFNMIIIGISSPFGLIAGMLSDMNRRLPFALALVLFIGMLAVVAFGQREKQRA